MIFIETEPDILVVPSFFVLMPPLRVFAENAFGCLQKQKLSLISKNPAARSLVDGKLNKQVNTHTHENRYPHPHRGFRRSLRLPAASSAATTTSSDWQVSSPPPRADGCKTANIYIHI
jgi:hypothetical protein